MVLNLTTGIGLMKIDYEDKNLQTLVFVTQMVPESLYCLITSPEPTFHCAFVIDSTTKSLHVILRSNKN